MDKNEIMLVLEYLHAAKGCRFICPAGKRIEIFIKNNELVAQVIKTTNKNLKQKIEISTVKNLSDLLMRIKEGSKMKIFPIIDERPPTNHYWRDNSWQTLIP